MKLTAEQKDSLLIYVDELRRGGRSYEEIAATLVGRLPDGDLAQLEKWHGVWKRTQWREKLKREHQLAELPDEASLEAVPVPAEAEDRDGVSTSPAGERETEMVRYLADNLLTAEVADEGKGNWRRLFRRALKPGQVCDYCKGPGEAGGRRWYVSGVVFRTGERIDLVVVEARVRARFSPEMGWARKRGYRNEVVIVEQLELVHERLNLREVAAKHAALLRTFLGKKSGIKSGAHLGRLTDRTRQAVSARTGGIVADYYERTGGKAGFEGVTSAAAKRRRSDSTEANEGHEA